MSRTRDGVRIRRSLLLGFSLPSFILALMQAPEIVQGVYATAGIPLAELGLLVVLTRVFDAATYPLIGWLSDLTAARSGSRKLWIAGGSVLSIIGTWFLFRPPEDVGAWWFGAFLALSYLGWKLTEIPYAAWSFALTSDYRERGRVQVWKGIAFVAGNLSFYFLPYLAVAVGASETTAFDFGTLGVAAVIIAVLAPLANAWCLWRVPDRLDGEPEEPVVSARDLLSIPKLWRSIVKNGPLLRLLVAYAQVSISGGMVTAVTLLYVDVYLRQGEGLALASIVGLAGGIAGIPIWGAIGARFERHRVWAASTTLSAITFAAQAFIPPDAGSGGLLAIIVCGALSYFSLAGVAVLVPAMTADVVDYAKFRFREDRAGIYAAVFAFVGKSVTGVAGGLALALLGWLGFDATATVQTGSGEFAIKLVYLVLPIAAGAATAVTIWRFPLTRARLAKIHALLARRSAEEQAARASASSVPAPPARDAHVD